MLDLRNWLMYQVHGRRLPPRRRKPRRGPLSLPHYRAWIRQQECCVCGRSVGVDPAHIGPHGYWQKAPDTTCVPLCRRHHDELHAIGRVAFEPKYAICFEIIMEGLFTEWSERQSRQSLPGERPDEQRSSALKLKAATAMAGVAKAIASGPLPRENGLV